MWRCWWCLWHSEITHGPFHSFKRTTYPFGGGAACLFFDAIQPLGVKPPFAIVETNVDTRCSLVGTACLLFCFALRAARLLLGFTGNRIGNIGSLGPACFAESRGYLAAQFLA